MTGREVHECILAGERPDYFPPGGMGPWAETVERWRREGLGPDEDCDEALGLSGEGAQCSVALPLDLNMVPPFAIRVLAKDEQYVTLVDEFGVTKKMRRADFDRTGGAMTNAGQASSMSHWIEYPVKDLSSWKEICESRFRPDLAGRVGVDWDERAANLRGAAGTKWVQYFCFPFFGLFGGMRQLMGLEGLAFAMFDQPSLVHTIVADLTDFWLETFARVLADAPLDMVCFFEDMCATKAPLVSPAGFREFLAPGYRKVIGALREMGVRSFFVDTDGNAWDLIPEMLACGVTGLLPCEVASGMDAGALREGFPALALFGGIDKRALARGPGAIDEELARRFDIAREKGRYLPHLDHGCPPDISWASAQHFAERYRDLCGAAPATAGLRRGTHV